MGFNLPRSGLVQQPEAEDGSKAFHLRSLWLPASDLER